ncbi:MAG: polysaccharide biosynthesis protein [Clostridia bacterium]|nr:polysaccharide biosynthesis protein [Clostridia bacterium]
MQSFKVLNYKYLILAAVDAICVFLAEILALGLRFDFENIPAEIYSRMLSWVAVDIAIFILIFFLRGLYRSSLALMNFNDLIYILGAVGVSTLLVAFYHYVSQIGMPRSFYFLLFGVELVLCIAVRVGVKRYFYFRGTLNRRKQGRKVMIVGAGSGADLLLREIERDKDYNYNVVALIDDNDALWNTKLRHIRIYGGRDSIAKVAAECQAEEIVIAIPSLDRKQRNELIAICNKTGCVVKILPEVAKSLTGQMKSSIRDVSIEDLIGRGNIEINQDEVKNFIKGKRVLVTGGGGSIGSELVRQITDAEPEKVVIFDIYENNAYAIQQELIRKGLGENIETLIGSVRDKVRLEEVFQEFKPQMVFHAAAHKHVPLMEDSPKEAIKNNCMGTNNMAELSDKYGVERFVLISTDKAVRPTNVMGASKRICEMIIQTWDKKSKTEFVAVRFGNVLGSNGSVVPLFLEQIEKGGPVTVTHKEITRFFMTIPEAVSLVLQASYYAEGGEIFVLDMGEPVKIYQLAETLIRLKGLIPDKDIKIEVTGLRPGEKLYEELLMDEEGLQDTANSRIKIGKPIDIATDFEEKLAEIVRDSYEEDIDIVEKILDICPTYSPNNN